MNTQVQKMMVRRGGWNVISSMVIVLLFSLPVAWAQESDDTAAGSGSHRGKGRRQGSVAGGGSMAVGDLARTDVTAPEAARPAAEATPTSPLAAIGELVGELVANRKVALAFKVGGRVENVALFAGDTATAGAPVARLDPQDFDLAVSQAEAALANIQARLRGQESGGRPEERKAADEAVRQARANLDNARLDVQRLRDLFKVGGASKQNLDAAEARATVTEAQYMTAIQQKALVEQGIRVEEKDATRAQVRQQEAAVGLSRLQRQYSVLTAPFAGAVAQRLVDEGTMVSPGTPIYNFVEFNPILAAVDCPERYSPLLTKGIAATVRVDAFPNRVFSGTIVHIAPVLDTRTRTARVEVAIDNPDMVLKPGMFARVTFAAPTKP